MAFINEYIPEADYEKYNLLKVLGEKNLVHRGDVYSQQWTIDRESNIFLVKTWSHHEETFHGWAFYWKGEWVFFEMRPYGHKGKLGDKYFWNGYLIRNINIPALVESDRKLIYIAIEDALLAYKEGGVFSPNYDFESSVTVTFETN